MLNRWPSLYRQMRRDPMAVAGLLGIALLLAGALFAPLLANQKPFLLYLPDQGWSMPFAGALFAPDTPEKLLEKTFNFALLFLPVALLLQVLPDKLKIKKYLLICYAVILLMVFWSSSAKIDATNYRDLAKQEGAWAVFAPIPYGPFETVGEPNLPPSRQHWMGTDNIGRSVASRMLYGSRVSLAVGLLATLIAMLIGIAVGMIAGYFRGKIDLATMRLVEIVMCFPSFLLLLILMSMFKDWKFEQSALIVVGVIGLTGWIGLAQLVRGEVLKQRALPYILSCEGVGMPVWRTMTVHLLPNIAGPLFISFSFGIAGAILAESSLSFLGFGVQMPTASWGGLLRQAFDDDPMRNWHLTFFPGVALFIAVCGFNFIGEALRKALDPKKAQN